LPLLGADKVIAGRRTPDFSSTVGHEHEPMVGERPNSLLYRLGAGAYGLSQVVEIGISFGVDRLKDIGFYLGKVRSIHHINGPMVHYSSSS
jgi:hypothetical protein